MTNKLENSYTKEVLAQLQKSTAQFPSWRSCKRTENLQGNRLLEGTIKSCVHRAQEKGAVNPQEIELDLPMSVWESPEEV